MISFVNMCSRGAGGVMGVNGSWMEEFGDDGEWYPVRMSHGKRQKGNV